ncbi:MAG: zinc ribbon domain-containing protein [Actinomycetota bacterium]|nr:zinc ribbon domain-containing protein [Actinomycetota bacterium]
MNAGTGRLAPIPVTVDNASDWGELSAQLSAAEGMPTGLNLETLCRFVGSAVPLQFAAEVSGSTDVLRGMFSDQMVVQAQRNIGRLQAAQPVSAAVRLVGAPIRDGRPELRIHVNVAAVAPDGNRLAFGEFWDLISNTHATVSAGRCPSCGAPLETGQLICEHCHADARTVQSVPLLVTRMELY